MKGMVISGSTLVRKVLRGILYSVDIFEVALLSSGPEGVETLETETFDVVLLDDCLSDPPVLDLIGQIRVRQNPIVIFVVGTQNGKSLLSNTIRVIRAGATGFIVHPFERAVVTRRIRQALLEVNKDAIDLA